MALETRQSTQTWFALGRNKVRGTPIVIFDAPSGDTAGMVQTAFAFSDFGLSNNPEVVESTLIRAFGASSPDIFGLFTSAGSMTTGVIPLESLHLLRGLLNPNSVATKKITNVNANDTPSNMLLAATTSVGSAPSFTDGNNKIAEGMPPSKVVFTFSAKPTGGVMRVKGIRKIGRPNNRLERRITTETIRLSETTHTTTKNYVQIDEISFPTAVAPGSVTFKADWDSGTHDNSMKFNESNELFKGWTMQGADGGEPFVAEDVTPISATISVSATGATISMDLIATVKQEKRILTSYLAGTEVLEFPSAEASHFPISTEREQPGWGGAFSFGGTLVSCTGLEIVITLNLATDTEVFTGSRFALDVIQTGNRTVTFTPTLRFQSSTDAKDIIHRWQDILENDDRTPLLYQAYNYLGTGERSIFEISSPGAQLTSNEVRSSAGSPVIRTLGFKALPTESDPSEITIRTQANEAYSES